MTFFTLITALLLVASKFFPHSDKKQLISFLLITVDAKFHKTESTFDKERIVGGIYVSIENYPYQAFISNRNRLSCGGSIISNFHILTAGHCVSTYTQPEEISVRTGSTSKSKGGTLTTASRIFCHPEFRKFDTLHLNDIAIVLLSKSLVFDVWTRNIPLARRNKVQYAGQIGIISGWGAKDDLQYPDKLRATSVLLVEDRKCQKSSEFDSQILCATYPGRNICSGDSGGPLVVNGRLVGVSVASLCQNTNISTYYVSVAFYRDWIDKMTGIADDDFYWYQRLFD